MKTAQRHFREWLAIKPSLDGDVYSYIFSFLLGLPIEECKGMYPETEMGDEELNLIDDLEEIFWEERRQRK